MDGARASFPDAYWSRQAIEAIDVALLLTHYLGGLHKVREAMPKLPAPGSKVSKGRRLKVYVYRQEAPLGVFNRPSPGHLAFRLLRGDLDSGPGGQLQ